MSTASRPSLCLCVCLMGVTWALALPVQTSTPVPNIKVEPVTDGWSLATSEASQSERTSESSSTSLSHSETFTSERAPEIVTSEAAIFTAFPLEASTTEKSIAKPNSQGEDSKVDSITEFSEEANDQVQCLAALDKFLIDFGRRYHSEIEKEKRRTVFCDNWRSIRKHNKLFEQHMVPYEMDINQFSDLTFEEWRLKQMPRPGVMRAPEIVTSEEAISGAIPLEASTKMEEILQTSTEKSIVKPPTNSQGEDSKVDSITEVSEEANDQVQCLAAWDKFLIDFGRRYHSEIEKEKRRTVFCDNWRSIRKHNKLFEQHMVPYEMDINQFSDLTFEEWRLRQMPRPGVMRAPEIVTSEEAISGAIPLEASTIVKEILQTSTKKSIVKPPTNSQEEDSKVDSITEVSEEANDQVQCLAAWDKFLIDFGGRYHSEIEKEKRRNVFCDNWRSIRKHNKLFQQHMVPYEMDINQFSDLTFEEWRLKQMPRPGVMRAPEIVTSEEAISGAIPLEASTIVEEILQTSTEKSIVKPPTNSQEEDSKVDSITEVSEEANDQVQCLAAWDKFLIDFGRRYHSEIEKEKRRTVFCDNWRSIRKHNKLFQQHMVPYQMDINQFSDLTFEEWRLKQMPRPGVMRAPEIVTSEEAISGAIPLEASTIVEEILQTSTEKSIVKPPTNSQEEDSKVDSITEVSEEANDQVQCLAAWDKFLIDFGRRYHSEIEKEKRRTVFCDNWRSIRKHNKLFEQHMVPYEMDINQFSDLTFEEWRLRQMPRPGVMRAPEIVTSEEAISGAIPLEASTIVKEILQTSTKKSIVKPPTNSQEEDSKVDSITEVSEEANDQVQCLAAWDKFLIDFGRRYHSEIEKEKRRTVFCDNWRSIRKHNKLFEQHMVPYQMDINQFSDLTFEEWRIKQMPRPVVMDQDF
ncbi:uncharacterized protein LOC108160772 isoform X2 [Drosophila miranda]|uniref:uncharacterized protein LOC108160772 isoform X2 n=1 Tax=Drosophila miranda TaxID=7229 RepID=UPI00143F4AB4|nr:uncharacterized protein LOC108160772 isoform X2 [Drosophila miranda]